MSKEKNSNLKFLEFDSIFNDESSNHNKKAATKIADQLLTEAIAAELSLFFFAFFSLALGFCFPPSTVADLMLDIALLINNAFI
jgi:hypothetical protein